MSPGKWKPKSWPTRKRRDFSGAGFCQWLPGEHQGWAADAMRRRWITPAQYLETILPVYLPTFFGVSRTIDPVRLHGMRFVP